MVTVLKDGLCPDDHVHVDTARDRIAMAEWREFWAPNHQVKPVQFHPGKDDEEISSSDMSSTQPMPCRQDAEQTFDAKQPDVGKLPDGRLGGNTDV